MYYSLYHILLSAIVGPVLHNFVDACGRTPARTQPRPDTTPTTPTRQTTTPVTPVTPVARHQQKCTEEEVKRAACLHGECYALDLDGGNRSAFCQCPELYEGDRCEELSGDFFVLYAAEVKKAGIAAGVVIIIIILTIIIVYCGLKRRRQRKRAQHMGMERDAQLNGNAAQPLMKEHAHVDTERIALSAMEKSPETNV
ncbi:pro-neuregulin-4, membrane-bound isoform-like [Pomacea canaliculata]|uniref:pro-neuregulin-4, membrane-bound isoform-like n=1 Tax=Pomacea canaliculata TaxID=400727 RepID=UPI000D73F76B|nr:pro-neuregulin-4, membrane-bound isoform-like [Pomacea canaliculata]XP_025105419.1 pro-neuregulin-4, membrane-bound isoform-like [Pomacea canaliculata]XP_025105427.1 pro-neuregulin-4, membrane-bound isoform-like [Pomacea canaliculata]